jgi:LmbE family N-acetylglucosaminyl deacetylase
MNFKRLLVLTPHTDDAELGSGGTIARCLENGTEIFVAVFSTAKESLPPGSDPCRLRNEFRAAMKVLGVRQDNLVVYDYPVRRLSYHRQEVLEELIKLRRDINPDAIVMPSGNDIHQDHQVLYAEGRRAFKDLTVLGCDLPWNQLTFSAQAYITLELRHLQRKWDALKEYKSQFQLGRQYFSWEFLEGLARVRGTQIRAQYAEAFEVVRVRW